MKKILPFLLLASFIGSAQAPSLQWQKALGGSAIDFFRSCAVTTDGAYIAAGLAYSNNGNVSGMHGISDLWVVKTDASGNLLWQKCLGSSGDDEAMSINATADGGCVVTGNVEANDYNASGVHYTISSSDFWIVKLNAAGSIEWQKALGGFAQDVPFSVQQTADGGYIVIGLTESVDGDVTQSYGSGDVWMVKLSASGAMVWQKSYGGSSLDLSSAVKQTNDGGFIFTGYTYSANHDVNFNHGGSDYWVVKIDAAGNLQWQKTFGGSGNDVASDIIQTADNGFVIVGYTGSNNGDVTINLGTYDCWIIKLNASGSLIWQKTFGGSNIDMATCIKQDTNGNYVISARTGSHDGNVVGSHAFDEGWIIKLNPSGALLWQKALGGSSDDFFAGMALTPDGGYLLAGATNSNDGDVSGWHGNIDCWLVKLGPDSLGIQETNEPVVSIFPNPVDAVLNIQTPITIDGIQIIDINGKIVCSQIGFAKNITVENLSSGTYTLQIHSESKKFQTKFIKQ